MKFEFDKKKTADALSGIMQNTVAISQKAASSAKSNISAMVEKSKADTYARKLKKYNPVFPEQYNSPEFNIPNMIIIVDDAVRRGIDVCEGSIGWLSNDTGMEVFHLYDEAVADSGIKFVPSATCDAVYYVDSFDRSRFIRIDCIFGKSHEERLAELKHIAYSLGAKRCSIEITEKEAVSQVTKKSAEVTETAKGVHNKESAQQESAQAGSKQRRGHIEVEFEGIGEPTRPTLKWFAHDDNINRLIDMQCSGARTVKVETLELSGSACATMSQKTAYTIDAAVGKIGAATGHISMDAQAKQEHHSTLLFHVEF